MPSATVLPESYTSVRFIKQPKRVSIFSPNGEIWALGLTPKGFDKFMRGGIKIPAHEARRFGAAPLGLPGLEAFTPRDPEVLFEIKPTFSEDLVVPPRGFILPLPTWWVLILGNSGPHPIGLEYEVYV